MVDYNSLDKNQSSEIDQSCEKELIENYIESTTSEKPIVFEPCPISTDTRVLLSNSSEKDFVCNSPSELKICNSLSSQTPSAVNKSSSFIIKSLFNDDRLLQSKTSESSYSSKSTEAGKKVN